MAQPAQEPTQLNAPARRGAGGGSYNLVLQEQLRDVLPPAPPSAREENEPDRTLEMRDRLRICGIGKALALARRYPPEHIEGWIASWEADRAAGDDIGPGALVRRIEEWGSPPPIRAVVVDPEVAWLERRDNEWQAKGKE